MTFTDVIIVVIIAALLGLVIFKNVKSRKKNKCSGCPYAKACSRAAECSGNHKSCNNNCGKSCH